MTHKPEIFADKRYPKHLDMYVFHMSRWISQARDEQETIDRVEFCTREFGGEFTAYAMAMLSLPKIKGITKESTEYTDFLKQKKTIH